MKKEKILSFIVSFCMILTMLIFSGIEAIAVGSLNPSFSQSFTVTNLTEGTHVEVLKTVDLNLDSDGNFNMPVLTWNDSVKNWVFRQIPTIYRIKVQRKLPIPFKNWEVIVQRQIHSGKR